MSTHSSRGPTVILGACSHVAQTGWRFEVKDHSLWSVTDQPVQQLKELG